MGKRAQRNRAETPVTLGWIVKKRYRKAKEGQFYEKVISKRMISEDAAGVFRNIAARSNPVVDGEFDVSYYVTEDGGFDDIPAGT